MSKSRKFLIWGGVVFGVLVCAAAGLLFALPRIVDMDAIGRNAMSTLHARYGVRSEGVHVSLLPYPHAIVYGAGITVPETLTAEARSIAVYPRIWPLLTGKFKPGEIHLIEPKIAVRLPENAVQQKGAADGKAKENPADHGEPGGRDAASAHKAAGGHDGTAVQSGAAGPGAKNDSGASSSRRAEDNSDKAAAARLARLRDRLVQLEGILSSALPGITIDARDGSLEVFSEKERVFWFHDIGVRAKIMPDGVDFKVTTGKSGIWSSFSFAGRIDPRGWKGSGEAAITGCAPRDLFTCFLPSGAVRIGDSKIDLGIKLTGTGVRELRADFTAGFPHLALERAEGNTVIKDGFLAGTVSVDSERLEISLSESRFGYPRTTATGRFTRSFSDKSATLDVDCRDVAAGEVRDVLLTVLGTSKAVQNTFQIVIAGDVPNISYYARAPLASELDRMEYFKLRGSIERGTVMAPRAELLVKDVWGDVVIEDGVLYGTDLKGASGGTSTTGGYIKVGLRKGDVPFHLDLPLKVDLVDLPPVLHRLVKDEIFLGELERVKDLKGSTDGRLILGESMADVKTRVQTGPFRMSGVYGRIPDPIELDGASFMMDGPRIEVRSMNAKSGRMKFTQLDFGYDWAVERLLTINAASPQVLPLNVVEPLVRAHSEWKNLLPAGSGPLKGAVIFDKLDFRGAIGDSSKWAFSVAGSFDNLALQTRFLSGPLTIRTGGFEAVRDSIVFKQVNAALADSSLVASGAVNGYFEVTRSVELSLSGRLGPIGNRDVAALVGLPKELRNISDLTVDHSSISWERGVNAAFDGEMLLPSGSKVDLRVVSTPDEVAIEKLAINDPDSDANISLKIRKRQFKIGFSGSLSNRTADRLLADNKLLTGPIQGKFSATLHLDEPRKSTAEGSIKISGFQLPLGFKIPAKIESAVLEAVDNRINVKSAMISWNESRLSLGGAVTMVENAYLVDMNAFADVIDLETLLEARREDHAEDEQAPADSADAQKPAQQQAKKWWDAPVTGAIRLRSERVTYGKLTWNPATADVVMSPGVFQVKVTQANLCGIATPGRVSVGPEGTSISVAPEAKDQDIEPIMACLFNKKRLITGKCTVNANLSSKTREGGIAEKLEGDVNIKAVKGTVYKFDHFAKIVSLLSITEIYRGHLPDLTSEGCAFDMLRIKGKVKAGKLTLQESVLDGPSMKMVFRGEVDIPRKRMDVVALVSPIRTVDRIIGVLPLVNKVFDAGIVSVPVRISGNIDDPSVVPLSPTAVGEELFGFMKRTFQLPFTILQPLTVGGGTQTEGGSEGEAGSRATGPKE